MPFFNVQLSLRDLYGLGGILPLQSPRFNFVSYRLSIIIHFPLLHIHYITRAELSLVTYLPLSDIHCTSFINHIWYRVDASNLFSPARHSLYITFYFPLPHIHSSGPQWAVGPLIIIIINLLSVESWAAAKKDLS